MTATLLEMRLAWTISRRKPDPFATGEAIVFSCRFARAVKIIAIPRA
jgi:hypothetical protein